MQIKGANCTGKDDSIIILAISRRRSLINTNKQTEILGCCIVMDCYFSSQIKPLITKNINSFVI